MVTRTALEMVLKHRLALFKIVHLVSSIFPFVLYFIHINRLVSVYEFEFDFIVFDAYIRQVT